MAKKVVYTPWEGKLKDHAKFCHPKHITTVRVGHFGKKGCIYALEKKVAQKLRHFSKFCVITYEGVESSDTFREKGEYTLRGVEVVKKVKIFPAVLQKTSYVASRGSKK